MNRNRFFTLLCAILALTLVAFNARVAATLPFGFDEAFNLQVVKSLATRFAYESAYAPAVAYNPYITTNGPIQYLAAFAYLLSRSFDTTIVIVTTMSMVLLMSAMFMIRPWIAAFFAVMYPFWSICVYAGTAFLGDIFATSAAFFGILSFERALARSRAIRSFRIGFANGAFFQHRLRDPMAVDHDRGKLRFDRLSRRAACRLPASDERAACLCAADSSQIRDCLILINTI